MNREVSTMNQLRVLTSFIDESLKSKKLKKVDNIFFTKDGVSGSSRVSFEKQFEKELLLLKFGR